MQKKNAVPQNPHEWSINFSVEKNTSCFYFYQKSDFRKIKLGFCDLNEWPSNLSREKNTVPLVRYSKKCDHGVAGSL